MMEELKVIHDSQDTLFRDPFGAVKIGTKIKIIIRTNVKSNIFINIINFYNNKLELVMKESSKPYTRQCDYYYEIELDTEDLYGVNYYFFRLDVEGQTLFYGNNERCTGGVGQIYYTNPKYYQITVHDIDSIPQWYKEGVMYQVFVDRFFNGMEDHKVLNPKKNSFIYGNWYDSPMYIRNNTGHISRWDFYGGNLSGVKKKLEYINSLGATIIYLNPIFESPSCHKYDTADYENIDGMFGTNEDFIQLCSEAKKLGIRIILDGVFSHTGDDSKYFNKFGNYKEIGAYESLQSKYYNWYKFSDYPNDYSCWWGFANMPEVDELESSYLDYIIRNNDSILAKWIRMGASGWRLDVADELPDRFIKLFKERLKQENNEAILIGEVWEDASNKVSYSKKREYLFGYELDSVTNYPIRQLIIDFAKNYISPQYFSEIYNSLLENYPKESFFATMNIIGNHDTERILTILNDNVELLKIVVSIQMTLPGVPLIYYGDECGLVGGKDPDNRKSYPWGRENKSILDFYKLISNLRTKEDVLKSGDIRFINNEKGLLCYERYIDKEVILVVANANEKPVTIDIENIKNDVLDLATKEIIHPYKEDSIKIDFQTRGCKILKYMG